MLTISVGESVISVPISSHVEICYTENGQEIFVDGQIVMQHIKTKIDIKVST